MKSNQMEEALPKVDDPYVDLPTIVDESTRHGTLQRKDDLSGYEGVPSYHLGNPIGLRTPNISMRNLVFFQTDLGRETSNMNTSKEGDDFGKQRHTKLRIFSSEKNIKLIRKKSESSVRNQEYHLKSHFRKSSQPVQTTQTGYQTQSGRKGLTSTRPQSFESDGKAQLRNKPTVNNLRAFRITREEFQPEYPTKIKEENLQPVMNQTVSVFRDYMSREENFLPKQHTSQGSIKLSSRAVSTLKTATNTVKSNFGDKTDPRMMSLIGNFMPVSVSSESWRKFQQVRLTAAINIGVTDPKQDKNRTRLDSFQKDDARASADMFSESVSSPMLERHESRNRMRIPQTPSILLKKSSQRSDSKHYRRTTTFGSQSKVKPPERDEHPFVKQVYLRPRKEEDDVNGSSSSDKYRQPANNKTKTSNSKADFYPGARGPNHSSRDRVGGDPADLHLQHHKKVIGDMDSLRRKILKLVSERSALTLYSKKQRSKVEAEPQPLPERVREPAFYEVQLGGSRDDPTEDHTIPQYFSESRIVKVTHQNQQKVTHLASEARSRKKFLMNHQKLNLSHHEYELELQDELIAQHASEKYMDKLEFNLDNCLEVCKSLSNNLAFAAEICDWRKFMFQSFVNECLNSIKVKLSITKHLNFVAEKKTLKASSKLRPSYYLTCLFTDDPTTWQTLFPILDGYFQSLEDQVTGKQITEFLCSFGVSVEPSLHVFVQLKEIDIQVSKFVIQRRMRNMTDDAEKILKQIQSIGDKDESYKFTIDKNFEQGKEIVAKMHEEVIQVGQIGKSLQQIMTETKKFTGVDCKVPEGYQKLQTAGHELLDRLRSVFRLKQENRRPTILLPVENKLGTITDQPIFPHFD